MSETGMREAAALEALGVSQKRLRALRHERLQAGVHWVRDAGGILYQEAGMAVLREAVGRSAGVLPLETAKAEPAPMEAAEASGTREDLRVTRVWSQREKMVLCDRPNGLEVVCHVRSSRNMMPGMLLKGCQAGEYETWYYYGPLPRRRGRL